MRNKEDIIMAKLLNVKNADTGVKGKIAEAASNRMQDYYYKLLKAEKMDSAANQPHSKNWIFKSAAVIFVPAAVLAAAAAVIFMNMAGSFEIAKAAVSAYGAAVIAGAALLTCSNFMQS